MDAPPSSTAAAAKNVPIALRPDDGHNIGLQASTNRHPILKKRGKDTHGHCTVKSQSESHGACVCGGTDIELGESVSFTKNN